MANEHMKTCSTLLNVRETQIKTTMRYLVISTRKAIIKNTTDNTFQRGCGAKGTLLHCWWECKLSEPLWRTGWRFLNKVRIKLPYYPAIPLLDIPWENHNSKSTCTPIFIAVLFTIDRAKKQLRCLLTDEWIWKMWYLYTVEYHSATQRNEFEFDLVAVWWMNRESVIQSEASQKEKNKHHMWTHICGI